MYSGLTLIHHCNSNTLWLKGNKVSNGTLFGDTLTNQHKIGKKHYICINHNKRK